MKRPRGIVAQIRRARPEVELTIRADSGPCREPILAWCEADGVDYLLGRARGKRLLAMIAAGREQARSERGGTEQASRVSAALSYRTPDGWSRARRVVAKAEHLAGGANPRSVVTSPAAESRAARPSYETDSCGRGGVENRIEERQWHRFADRTGARTMRADRIRWFFSAIA